MDKNVEFLKTFAELIPNPSEMVGRYSQIWVTKSRGDYVTMQGMEDKGIIGALMEHGVDQNISSVWEAGSPINIGYSSVNNKWYGWSHRAIFGFAIGSTCKLGDCQYKAAGPHDFIDQMENFWFDREFCESISTEFAEEDGLEGLRLTRRYNDQVLNPSLRNTEVSMFIPFPDTWGRGTWTAETMAEAREMAIDFANGVS